MYCKLLQNAQHSRKGIALIMVLIIVVVLGLLAGGFAYSMKVETKLARNATWDADMEWLGRAGIEAAKFCLSQRTFQSGNIEHLGQAWAGGTKETNEVVAQILNHWVAVGNGEFKLQLEDLDRKLNINELLVDDVLLSKVLGEVMFVDAAEASKVTQAIMEWKRRDTQRGDRFVDLKTRSSNGRFGPKHGRIDDLSELLLIEGVTEKMFYGTGSSGDSRQRPRSARASHFEEPDYPYGLVDFFTANSGRQLNINTASRTALLALPFVTELAADEIIRRRTSPNGIEGDSPFRSAGELATIPGIDPIKYARYSMLAGVNSTAFLAKIETRIGKQTRVYIAHIRRLGMNNYQTLNMTWQ